MAFELNRTEPVLVGIRRVAEEEMAWAAMELLDPGIFHDQAVHKTRKRLKKLRALLRLVQPRMSRDAFREQNRALRDLGRALSEARDAEVILATLHSVSNDFPELSFARLHDYLLGRRDAGQDERGPLESQRQEVASALRQRQASVFVSQIRGKGFALLGPGLEQTYRRGREASKTGFADQGDEVWHNWRKRAKEHWNHIRLLKKTWPEMMESHARALEALSDFLGAEHDLTVLDSTLRSLPAGVIDADEIETLQVRIGERKTVLRERASALGQRLYAEKPTALRKRVHVYWQVWRS